jgi:hypothetical protein
MESIPNAPDRASAEADRRRLAELSPDAPCELPASRVRAYVHAYLNSLPPTKPTAANSPSMDAPSVLRELARQATASSKSMDKPSRLLELARQVRAGRVVSLAVGDRLRPTEAVADSSTRSGSFWPRWAFYVTAAIGLASIVMAKRFLPGGLEMWGEGIVTFLFAALAIWYREERRIGRNRFTGELLEPNPPLRSWGEDAGWMRMMLGALGWLAALLVLWIIFYRAPRLVGFQVDILSAGFAAFLISGLLAYEWGLVYEDDA